MYTKLVTNKFLQFLFLGVLLFCSTISSAQLQYNFERINTDNGLPTNAIKGLQFDEKNRFLWVATESGIVRYNGYDFQSFGDNEQSNILNGRIVFFLKAENGKLFGKLIDESVFEIEKNKAVLNKKKIKISNQNDYLNYKYGLNNQINFSNFRTGNVDQSNFELNQTLFTKYYNILYAIKNDKVDSILKVGAEMQGFVLNSQLFIYSKLDGLFKQIMFKQDGEIIVNNLPLSAIIGDNVVKNSVSLNFVQNNTGEPVYLIAGSDLFKLNYINQHFKLQLVSNKIPDAEIIKYIQIDNVTNTIYLGTDNRGMIVGRPNYFRRLLPNNAVSGVSTSAYAQLLLPNGNVQINTGQIFGTSTLKSPNIFYRPSETATFISSDSSLFFTNSDGIIEYDLKNSQISSIHNDSNIRINRNNYIQLGDSIFSFNESGVALKNIKFGEGKWRYLIKFKKTPFNFIVYNLAIISESEILAATTDGLYKYHLINKTFKLFYRDKNKANFRSIFPLKDYFLLGTYGGGVYMLKGDSIKKVPLDQNKYLNFTHCFLLDNKQRVWASTNKGLFMSPSQSLIDFWTKGPGNIRFAYYGKSDGIDQLEFNGGCSPCAIKLKNGDFSFPGIDGLIQFNPDSIAEITIQPKVYLDKLVIDDKSIDFNESVLSLPPKTKNIDFHLGISGMLSQENIMLEYKFDNDKWNRINVRNSIIKYTNATFGEHTIYLRIRNTSNGKWDSIEYAFVISYPWTLHPLMYGVYVLLIIGIVLLYIRFKTLIYQRRQKLLEKEVNLKTESLNKLNDYLLKRNQAKDHVIAIMNHDILTPLKYLHITAKNIADSNNPTQIKSSIKQIADTSKELEYLTSNMLNWVKFDNIEKLPKEQYFDLSVLVNDLIEFVYPFKQNKNVQIINKIPNDTFITNWPDSLRVLIYNLLVNSIKATNNGEIVVGYKGFENGYSIFVQDSGIGMNASIKEFLLKGRNEEELEYHPKNKTGNGVGYQIIRNIILLMNASLDIQSDINVGTTVTIIFK